MINRICFKIIPKGGGAEVDRNRDEARMVTCYLLVLVGDGDLWCYSFYFCTHVEFSIKKVFKCPLKV